MNKVRKQCHIQAMSENLELGLLGGLVASVIDSVWVLCDIYVNGLHLHYIIILTGLTVSVILIGISLIRHHQANVKNGIETIYTIKKQLVKYKVKHIKKLPKL